MTTWILFGLILLAMFFAARYALRKARRGECVGCSGCKGGGCRCQTPPSGGK